MEIFFIRNLFGDNFQKDIKRVLNANKKISALKFQNTYCGGVGRNANARFAGKIIRFQFNVAGGGMASVIFHKAGRGVPLECSANKKHCG